MWVYKFWASREGVEHASAGADPICLVVHGNYIHLCSRLIYAAPRSPSASILPLTVFPGLSYAPQNDNRPENRHRLYVMLWEEGRPFLPGRNRVRDLAFFLISLRPPNEVPVARRLAVIYDILEVDAYCACHWWLPFLLSSRTQFRGRPNEFFSFASLSLFL